MTIGILAVQGDFELHQRMLSKLGVESVLVRNPEQLKKCDGLIIPGGESTTFIKLLKANDLDKAIKDFGKKKQVMGTCAGLISIARKVNNFSMETLNLIDVEVARNAYGRQIDSFIDSIDVDINGQRSPFEGVFIRAPKIEKLGEGIKPIGFHKGNIVLAESSNILVATFHPELSEDTRIQQHFIEKIKS